MKNKKGNNNKYIPRVLTIAYRPVHYHAGIYKEMQLSEKYRSKICYLDTVGLTVIKDKFFGCDYKVDLPLLEGQDYMFLKNYGWDRSDSHFFSGINPSILKIVKKYDIIFFLANSTFSHWLGLFSAIIFRKKIIWRGEATLTEHDNWKSRLIWNLKKPLLNFFFRRCDALMYSCTGNKKYIESFKPKAPLFPIWCSVDNKYYHGQYLKLKKKRKQLRNNWNISENDIVIIFPARLIERKNPFLLIEACEKLNINKKKICLLFVGDGNLQKTLETRCKKSKIKAIFTGFQTPGNISQFYTIADIFMISSFVDFSPKTLNEAMNFQLPLIVSEKIGTAYDLVLPGKNGYLIDPKNSNQVKAVIEELLSEKKRKIMGEKSFEHVKNFNFKQNAKNIDKMISYILDKGK